MKEIFTERKFSVILTLVILIAGSMWYLLSGEAANAGSMSIGKQARLKDNDIFKDIRLKIAYEEEKVDVFALVKYNEIARIKAVEGNSIPETDTIVLGYEEGRMMKEEKEFDKVGDKLEEPGIDVALGGILSKTGTVLDEFHFLSDNPFNNVQGEEGRLFIKLNEKKIPKLFFYYRYSDNLPLTLSLKEGDIKKYSIYDIVGQKYYPLMLGAAEAKMMREEDLFSKPGDIIKNFFGKNVVVVGVLNETNSALDMMYLIPLSGEEI